MKMNSATVFVIDDEEGAARTLEGMLRSAGYQVDGHVASNQILSPHERDAPCCLVLDLAASTVDGREVQSQLAASTDHRPVILLSGAGSIIATTAGAVRTGAVTFLTGPVHSEDLFAAIDEALRFDAIERQRRSYREIIARRFASLTPREREVFAHVVAGRLNKQIAADLGTVVKTIKVHRARVMQKMGARSLAQLVQFAAYLDVSGESAGPPLPSPPSCAGVPSR